MTLDFAAVETGFLATGLPPELVAELLEAFTEAKRRFYRTDLRPNAVEGGRFAEATFRVLEWATTGTYTPVGKTLPRVDQLLRTLENSSGDDSVRLHIPRTLRLIYDIRNKRDAAHLADGIDPNLQDATLVVRNMEWVLAELVRQYHKVTADEAQKIITDLVTKEIPVIQLFAGFPRVLRNMKASDHSLVLLYWRGTAGATFAELSAWVRPTMRANLRRTLAALDKKDLVHSDGTRWFITRPGEQNVEAAGMIEPVLRASRSTAPHADRQPPAPQTISRRPLPSDPWSPGAGTPPPIHNRPVPGPGDLDQSGPGTGFLMVDRDPDCYLNLADSHLQAACRNDRPSQGPQRTVNQGASSSRWSRYDTPEDSITVTLSTAW